MGSPRSVFPAFVVLASAGALLFQISPGGESTAHAGAAAAEGAAALADAPIDAFRNELLELAFDAASAMPLEPHVKNRSRAQESVIGAWIELGQSRRALDASEQVIGWRRGDALADLAFDRAKRGDAANARDLAGRALAIAATVQGDGAQDWQRDRIRAKAARTLHELGDTERAASTAQGLVGSERTWVEAAEARRTGKEQVEQELAGLETLASAGGFDGARAALAAQVELFARFYGDAELRARIETSVESAWSKLPVQIRIETLGELVRVALESADPAKARTFAGRAGELVRSMPWTPDVEAKLLASVSRLHARAGDAEGALELVKAGTAVFERERALIVDIDRASVLRSLAEARVALGEIDAARELYARAIGEGLVNPNSRPRADDLGATCASMAVHGVEPDAATWNRLREARAALGSPW